ILVFFGIAGQFLLHAMGISLLSFQIAGGIILLLFAVSMVLGENASGAKPSAATASRVMDVAIYPVATPIIAGPGAMLAVVILTDNNRFTVPEQIETLGVLAVVLFLMLAIFLAGDVISKLIGRGGTGILRRV